MISVIIPVYNSERFICEAVDSALTQSVSKEIIVIDDCSMDNSLKVLIKHLRESYTIVDEAKNTEGLELIIEDGTVVRLFRCKRNGGVSHARNLGVEQAAGDYIAFLDADDWWAEDKLSKQLACIEKTNALICNTARELYNEDGTSTQNIIETPEIITYKMLTKTNYINCSAVLVKRDIMLLYPMTKMDGHEDYLTWLEILKDHQWQENAVVGINEPLLKYRLSKQGKSRNKIKAAIMTYKTYRMAGYGAVKAGAMMVPYMINGIKKYSN